MEELTRDNPLTRRLWGNAFDSSLSFYVDNSNLNNVVLNIQRDDYKQSWLTGEYVKIIVHDTENKCFYSPVDLSDINLVSSDGFKPFESDTQFHQQIVFAVSMTTMGNFEKASVQRIFWSTRYPLKIDGTEDHDNPDVPLLMLYLNAITDANAFYAPNKKVILCRYLPAVSENTGIQLP